jgi:hypothetical protein
MVQPRPAERADVEPSLSRATLWSYALPGFGVGFLYTLVMGF